MLSVYDDILCQVHSKAVTTSVILFTTLGAFCCLSRYRLS
nr:MAG TPA: hypothetical protein [Caudoviricetes sp.]